MNKNFKDSIPAVLALLLLLYMCFVLPSQYPNALSGNGQTVEVVVSPGMSARQAASAIVRAGVTNDVDKLTRWMVKFAIDKSLKPGLYKLNRGNVIDVALQLKTTEPVVDSVTLIPGMRYWKIAETLYGSADGVEALNAELSNDKNFPEKIKDKLPEKAQDRIAFLLPETYYVVPDSDKGSQVIRRAAATWWERVGRQLPEDIDQTKLLDMATLASIVEGEAKVAEERPVLAGIFASRMEKRMKLQSCATIIYSWELTGVKKSSLTYKDLAIESPYNTYMNEGLPPGPISIPSEASWQGAANPASTSYLFFFATADGSHIFSKTYEEHLRLQREILTQ